MTEKLSKAEAKSLAAKQRVQNTQEAIKDVGGVSGQRLKAFVERIERLEEEKKGISEDVRDVYAESKATGFDPKIIRKVVGMRRQNIEKRREENELVSLYTSALGMAE